VSIVFTNEYEGLAQDSIDHIASSIINAVCGDSSLLIGDVVKLLPAGTGTGFTQPEDVLPRIGIVDDLLDDAYGVVVGGDLEGIYSDGIDIADGLVVSFFGGGVRVCTQGRCVARIFPETNSINVGDPLIINPTNTSLQVAIPGLGIIARALQSLSQNFSVDDVTFAAIDIQREAALPVSDTFITATGGTETTDDDFKIHTFTTSGTFTIISNPLNASMEILLLAGGGGGAGSDNISGGGGGAGEYYNANITRGVASYTVTLGAGGAGGAVGENNGNNGEDSVFDDLTVFGGGGGTRGKASADTDGLDGGSGGGAGAGLFSTKTGGLSTALLGVGFDGGDAGNLGSGGGGGASEVGEDGNIFSGGTGGDGQSSEILETGDFIIRAGGGGGAGVTTPGGDGGGAGGTGGGGKGGTDDEAGDDAIGNGSGGGGAVGDSFKGGDGSDGIVIIRYQFQ